MLDTNVLIHDPNALLNFEEHHVATNQLVADPADTENPAAIHGTVLELPWGLQLTPSDGSGGSGGSDGSGGSGGAAAQLELDAAHPVRSDGVVDVWQARVILFKLRIWRISAEDNFLSSKTFRRPKYRPDIVGGTDIVQYQSNFGHYLIILSF